MDLKILKIHGDIKPTFGRDGNSYPAGTQRDTLAYYFVSRTVAGENRRGFQVVRQEATLETVHGFLDIAGCEYNDWKDVKFLDTSQVR